MFENFEEPFAGSQVSVSDGSVRSEYHTIESELFDILDSIIDEPDELVDFRGNSVTVSTYTALVHLIDRFQDHFNSTAGKPEVKITLDNLRDIGDKSKYKAKDEGPGHKFIWEMNFRYKIDTKFITIPYFAIDDIIIDMTPAIIEDTIHAETHGKSWLIVYFTLKALVDFCRHFKDDTGWSIKSTQFEIDKSQGLASICVSIDKEEPPRWNVVRKIIDPLTKTFNDEIELDDVGNISEIIADSDYQGLYQCTGIFSSNFNVVSEEVDDHTVNTIKDEVNGRFSMCLLGVRVFGKTNKYRKIRSGIKKNMRSF